MHETQRAIEDHIDGGTFCIGSPETCINMIKKYKEKLAEEAAARK